MIIPPEYAQANIKFTGTGAPSGAEITLGLNRELYASNAAGAAYDVLIAFQAAAIRARLANSVTIAKCLVKFGPNNTGPAAEHSSPLAGTNGGAGTSPGVAFLARKNTGFGGRTGRGRLYIPGVPEGEVDTSGNIGGAIVTSWNTALEAFRTTLISLGLVPTLLHAAGSPIQVPMPITSFTMDGTVATQRRRQRR